MSNKLWQGRTSGNLFQEADDFNSSITFDSKMYAQDIKGSIAHATMLAKQNIISNEDSVIIINELKNILADIELGNLEIDLTAEDIHMFVEAELTKRIGDVGKKLHTARSRNDQVAVDLKMFLRDECDEIIKLLKVQLEAILYQAKQNKDTIVSGYTHLQKAQPIYFAHHLLCYAQMFMRDIGRIIDAKKRLNFSPLGSCALAGTTYPTDREFTANLLDFDGITENSIDGVSDRDYCVELLADISIIMMHLSRFSEEVILWTSLEFGYITLDDSFTTGSSIMPQKKNSDMAELVRGKTGRVYGDLIGTLTMLKGLPLAYNKDMQEDKESIFDAVLTVKKCLTVFAPMIKTMVVHKEKMLESAKSGYINATDLADYLTKKGMPFRSAYKIVGQIVGDSSKNNKNLEDFTLDGYKKYSDIFENDLYNEISLKTCVEKRTSQGGTGLNSIEKQIDNLEEFLGKL